MRPTPNRAGLGSTTDIDEPPPQRLVCYESSENEFEESEEQGDEGLDDRPTFPEDAGAPRGGSADDGTSPKTGGSAGGGRQEEKYRIFKDSDSDSDLDEDSFSGVDEDDGVEAFFNRYRIGSELVVRAIAKLLNVPQRQAQCLADNNIVWPSSADLVLEGVKEGGDARGLKELAVVRDSRLTFDLGQEADDQLRGTGRIQLGSAMRCSRSRLVFGPVTEPLGGDLQGVVSQKHGFFGPMMDAVESNRPIALFYRCLVAALQSQFNTHGRVRVSITTETGEQQDFGEYTTLLDGSGALFDDLVRAGELCVEHAPDDRLGRDTTNDVNVFPPSANLCGLVMGVLCTAKVPPSMVADPSATKWLRESGVDEKFIPSVDDKAVAFHTMSSCLEKTLSFANTTLGRPFYIEDAGSLSPGAYHARMAVERGMIVTIRRSLRDNIGATKNKFTRDEVGEEEGCHALHETWTSSQQSIRSAAAMVSLLSCWGVHPEIFTGMRVEDFHLDVMRKEVTRAAPGGGTETFLAKVVVLRVDRWTMKHGVMDGQDRMNGRKIKFSVTSCPEMPPCADPVMQVVRLFDSTGRLQENVATCLDKEEFLLVHMPFKQGRDCACDAVKHRHEAPPTAGDWHSAYSQLQTDKYGRKILCNFCGHIDDELTHVPSLIKKLRMGLAFPGAKSAGAYTSLVKRIFAIVGLNVTALSPYSYGRWYDRASCQLGGRDPAVSALGHDNPRTIGTYNSTACRQGEGGQSTTVDFVMKGSSLDVSEQHAGGLIPTLTPVDELLKADISKQVPFTGNSRYCRLPDGYHEAMAGLPVVVKAEEELLRVFKEEAAKLDALVDKDQDKTSPEPFVEDIDFTERGWATLCFERSEKLFAKDQVKKKAVKDIVEGMVTLLNDTVIKPERMLGGAVEIALRQQWSMEAAAAPAPKDRPSIIRGAVERMEDASKEPGGLKRLFDNHIPRLIISFKSIPTQRAGEVARAKKARDELLERRKLLLAQGVECTLTPRDIEVATGPICLRSTFYSTRPQIRRGGRGWVNGLPRKTKQARGGSVGRKLGSAQYNRPPDSTPSETGFSLQTIHGAKVNVAECPAGPDCLAVFTGAELVNKNMGSHLRIAHDYTGDQLANEFALHHFKCPCGDPSHVREDDGEVIPTDPKTVFSHLRKAREPSEEDRIRMEGWASVVDSARALAKMTEEIRALLPATEEQEAACFLKAQDLLAKILSVSRASLTTTPFNQSPQSPRARGSTATNKPNAASPRHGSIRSSTRSVGNSHGRTPAGLWGGRPASSHQAKSPAAVAGASAPAAPPAPAAATAQGEGAAAATAHSPAASTNSSTTTTSTKSHHKRKKQTNPQSPPSGRIIQKLKGVE